MCYTGQCKYEGYMGDCLLINPKVWPDDAGCTLAEKGIEEYENSLGGNMEDKGIVKGRSTYFGVEEIDGKLACSRCKTINPKVKRIIHLDGTKFFSSTYQCDCGNGITINTEREEDDGYWSDDDEEEV